MHNRKKINKTRKPHLCEMCLRRIPAGSPAVSMAGISEDNDFYHGYMCTTCDQITDTDAHDPWYFGDVAEILEKGQSPEDLLSKIKQEEWERISARTGTLAMLT